MSLHFLLTMHWMFLLAQIQSSTPPSPHLQHRPTTRPFRRHTSRSESHTTYTTPESSLTVTQSLTTATLRRTSAAQDTQMKKTKSLDHQLSSEADDYGGIEQVDYALDSHEELGETQSSITSADITTNGHVTDHVTLRKHSYELALKEQDLDRLQKHVGSGDGMGNVDLEMGMRRYRHDTELLPVSTRVR